MHRKVAIISFTENGIRLELQIRDYYQQRGAEPVCFSTHEAATEKIIKVPEGELLSLVGKQMEEASLLIFIGACGIAVRMLAPFLKGKTVDPAVLVLDERALHVISLLSGHLGGGNEEALALSEELQADPVITTASDVNGLPALDVLAKKNHLVIFSMKQIKEFQMAILEKEPIACFCEQQILGRLPENLKQIRELPESSGENCYHKALWIALKKPMGTDKEKQILWMPPRCLVAGIGCKAGKTREEIETALLEVLTEYGFCKESVAKIASIEFKKEESGLLELSHLWEIPFVTFSVESLQEQNGIFERSVFVEQTVGVDNVCERSAMAGCREGTLLIGKQKKNGVTVAIAMEKWSVQIG